jgi:hypothetical protein
MLRLLTSSRWLRKGATLNRISRDDLDRLAAIAGLLGSDGEVLSAARQARRWLADHKSTWREVLAPPAVQFDLDPRNWREVALGLAGNRAWLDRLNDWEISFIRELPGFAEISERQIAALRRVLEKVRLAEGRS